MREEFITRIYSVNSIVYVTRPVQLELGFFLNLKVVVFMLNGKAFLFKELEKFPTY
jgi:hypothetical protein